MKKFYLLFLLIIIVAGFAFGDYEVAFNEKSFIFHSPTCEWARKCTLNCVYIPKSVAIKRGGRACKVCKGVQ